MKIVLLFNTSLVRLIAAGIFLVAAAAGAQYPSNLEMLDCGEIKPRGWIYEQMKGDLEDGYITHYDEISFMASRDIFVSGQTDYTFPAERKVPTWWCGEVEGLWKESITKLAFLTGNKEHQQASAEWIARLMDHQVKNDGYIGMYNPEVRLNHGNKQNGELWTMALVMLNMLAYHEYTGDTRALESVQNAVDLVISTYNKDNEYFLGNYPMNVGGTTHGLHFVDVLEWLYRETGDRKYADFAVFLYKDDWFTNVDSSIENLLNEEYKFRGHGAHFAEQLMVPFFVATVTDDPVLEKASDNAMEKLRFHFTPGGGINSDEAINRKRGTADSVKEYCTTLQLMRALSKITMITGNMEAADWVETLANNAAQIARFHPNLTAVQYCAADNQLHIDPTLRNGRDTFGACHAAAPCCAMSAARFMPYFLESMWMHRTDHPGLVAMQYGPCQVNTTVGDANVTLTEETMYPFSDSVSLKVEADKDAEFRLYLRKPAVGTVWIEPVKDAEIIEGKDFVSIKKSWRDDSINVRFNHVIEKIMQPKSETVGSDAGGVYYKRGPLVFALPLESVLKKGEEFGDSGFYYWDVLATDKTGADYAADPAEEFTVVRSENGDNRHPWVNPPISLKGKLVNASGQKVDVTLVPEACSILRRVTFPVWQPE